MEKLKAGFQFLTYKLERCIGKGAFGAVWAAQSSQTGQMVAVKFEFPKIAKSLLADEAEIVKACSSSDCFPRYFGHGNSQGLNYLVLENLGLSLRQFQESHSNGIVPLNDVGQLGIGMVKALRDFHELGFVHRDVKPSNFVFRNPRDRQVCLIDFGLSKRWKDTDGTVFPPRADVGFRGTARYASVNSHDGADLGRRDDLWSVFYIIIEFAAPPLPWRQVRDKEGVGQMKRVGRGRLCTGLPPAFQEIADHLGTLNFLDAPDYDLIIEKLNTVLEEVDGGSDLGPVVSGQYGSMALIAGHSMESVLGSSSAVQGSWAAAPIVAGAVAGADSDPASAASGGGGGGCCILL
jgi:tau tubulin kinase